MTNIIASQFSLAGEKTDCISFICKQELNSKTASDLRNELARYLKINFPVFYIDAKDVENIDLSGMNEIIHSHFLLASAGRKLVFLFRKNSVIEKWVHTTGIDRFISTAVVPE